MSVNIANLNLNEATVAPRTQYSTVAGVSGPLVILEKVKVRKSSSQVLGSSMRIRWLQRGPRGGGWGGSGRMLG